jgi:OmpA-OmpF porin, OOP family
MCGWRAQVDAGDFRDFPGDPRQVVRVGNNLLLPTVDSSAITRSNTMSANLLALAQDALGNDFSKYAGSFLGESPGTTQSALSSLLPAVVGGIAQKGATPEGASSLMSLINGANLDVNALGNVAGLFGSGGAGMNELLKQGTSRLVPTLFGDKSGALVNALSSASGIKSSSATSLLAMTVPLVLAFLKKFIGTNSLNPTSLSSLLASQGPNLRGALDGRITSALGYANPSTFVGGLGAQASAGASRAGAAIASGATAAANASASTAAVATAATKSALTRWLPWLFGAVALLILWNIFGGRQVATPVAAPKVATLAQMPVSMTGTLPAKVYFDVGAAAIGADGNQTIAMVADTIKKDNVKVAVTGYTDKTGDTAKNEELAKSRASAVLNALKAAGVAESNIAMKPPLFVEIGAGSSDAEARRVEISKS